MAQKRDTYDDLYWKYRSWVVLILKQFMYKGYDESARVLSYLLEYKLYESSDGIASAGPDKEKIMNVLSDHHVNYVISEFGEITEMKSFKDNRFNKYLHSSSNLVIERELSIDNKSLDENSKEQSSTPSQPESLKKIEMPEWLITGLVVSHKTFGGGIITSLGNSSFSVEFSNVGEKKFTYPYAFEKGFLMRVI